VERPWLVAAFAVLTLVRAVMAARGLGLRTDFVALPITFGIGVDYAVNVMQRARLDVAA